MSGSDAFIDTPARRLELFLLPFTLCLGVRVTLILRRDLPGAMEISHDSRSGWEMARRAVGHADRLDPRRLRRRLGPFGPRLAGFCLSPGRGVSPGRPRLWRMRFARCLLSATFASLAIALPPTVARATGPHPGAGLLATVPTLANLLDQGLETHGERERPLAALTLPPVLLDAVPGVAKGGGRPSARPAPGCSWAGRPCSARRSLWRPA